MTVEAPPGATPPSGFLVNAGQVPGAVERVGPGRLPAVIAGWSVTEIKAGWWLSAVGRAAPAPVLALAGEPGRSSLVVDAPGPDQHTDELIGLLFPLLSSGSRSLRLILSAGADRYATVARGCGIDLLAAEAAVEIPPYGYAVVRSAEPAPAGRLPQWRRCLPSGDQQLAGALAPSPAWEQSLNAGHPAVAGRRMTVRRVPAGLALQQDPPGVRPALGADAVWPDPDRVTIVMSGALDREAALDSLASLLPLGATDGVRLYWPRAASGAVGEALRKLATSAGTDLIAPVADISASGFGGVCHGPAGAAPWLRFTSDADVQVLGSRYPVPRWEDGLAEAELSDLPGALGIEQIAAGLCIYRPGPSERGLTATGRSIIPELAGPMIVVGGDARDADVRQNVERVLRRLPAVTVRRLRILLTGAGAGGRNSYAQFLADTLGATVTAPAGRWTATPDGRVRALPVAGPAGPGARAQTWLEFSPRGRPAPEAPPTPGQAAGETVFPPVAPSQVRTASGEPRPAPPVETGHAQTAAVPEPVGVVWPPVLPVAPAPPVVARPAVAAEPPPVASEPESVGVVRPPAPPVAPPRTVVARPAVAAELPPVAPEPVGVVRPPAPSVPPAPPVVVRPPAPPEPPGVAAELAPVAPTAGAPPGAPTTMGQVVLFSRDHRSSTRERLLYRESATRYATYVVAVRRVLTQRPGLRAVTVGDGEDAVVTDFAAVLDFLADDQRSVAAALRLPGGVVDHRIPCVISGLRRLPSFNGAVFSSASLPAAADRSYAIGATVIDPAFVWATSARLVRLEGNIEYVIWSQTGKRVAALAPDLGRDEIFFAAGTPYKVLRVDATQPEASQARVFLREAAPNAPAAGPAAGQPAAQPDEIDRRVLERLLAAAALRDDVAAEDRVLARRAGSTGQPIGLDAHAVPFQPGA